LRERRKVEMIRHPKDWGGTQKKRFVKKGTNASTGKTG